MRRGFTLAECVLAILVVSVGVAGILGMWGTVLHAQRVAAEETRALPLARGKLADVCLGGISELGETTGYFPAPNERFRWYVLTSQLDDAPLIEVTVAVYWPTPEGERSICTAALLPKQ